MSTNASSARPSPFTRHFILLLAHVAVLLKAALALRAPRMSVPGLLSVDECARQARGPSRGETLGRQGQPVLEKAVRLLNGVRRRKGRSVGRVVDVVVWDVCERKLTRISSQREGASGQGGAFGGERARTDVEGCLDVLGLSVTRAAKEDGPLIQTLRDKPVDRGDHGERRVLVTGLKGLLVRVEDGGPVREGVDITRGINSDHPFDEKVRFRKMAQMKSTYTSTAREGCMKGKSGMFSPCAMDQDRYATRLIQL